MNIQRILIGGLTLITTILIIGSLGYAPKQNPEHRPPVDAAIPQRVAIEGTWECLPHKDTSGPQTLECAFGVVTNEGLHYAVNTQLMSTYPFDFTSGTRVKVEGVLVRAEALSSDLWQKYPIEGIISATSILKL